MFCFVLFFSFTKYEYFKVHSLHTHKSLKTDANWGRVHRLESVENEFLKSQMSPAATSHFLVYLNNYYKLDKLH